MIRAITDFDLKEKHIKEVLGANGFVSQKFENFEERPEQIEMSCAVCRAFDGGRHLAVEAGTGVGKSFAYLVPAIQLAAKNANRQDKSSEPERTLISTYTITLQEQLINKDIPLLAKCLPENFMAVLAKGRNNYLCKRRLRFALEMQRGLFDESAGELEKISEWSKHTKHG
jgi:ATP-dependent DNA helicase DinG